MHHEKVWQALRTVLFLAFAVVAPSLAGAVATRPPAPIQPVEATNIAARAGGEVYLLRGFGDVFSRGLDAMARSLRQRGIQAEVENHDQWPALARRIVEGRKRRGPRPVVLIGHSLGANAVILLAESLKEQHIGVQYMATFAATAPTPVPSNVRRVDNYYFASGGWGEPLVAGPGFSGQLRNRDYSHAEGIGHFNIDKQPAIQREVLSKVMRYVKR